MANVAHVDWVPRWVRLALGAVALMNVAFGIAGYLDGGLLFHGAAVTAAPEVLRHASWDYSARNLAIGVALAVVAARGVPESVAIVTIIRALIELQTIGIAVATGTLGGGTAMAVAFLVLELVVIKTVIGVIAKRDAERAAA